MVCKKTFERENSPCFLTVMDVFSSARVNGLFSVFSNVSTGIHNSSFSWNLNILRHENFERTHIFSGDYQSKMIESEHCNPEHTTNTFLFLIFPIIPNLNHHSAGWPLAECWNIQTLGSAPSPISQSLTIISTQMYLVCGNFK